MTTSLETIAARVLPAFDGLERAALTPFGAGLINRTYLVTAGARRFVLQQVNPIFPAAIHDNIQAVTGRLVEAGLVTPTLVPTRDARPCLDLGPDGVFRVLTFVDGASFDVAQSAGQARAAGRLVARFHRALDGLPHRFVGLRTGVHDTPRHVERLREALTAHRTHRLHAEVAALGAALLARAAEMPELPPLPDRVCHGDLKFNNVLFAAASGAGREEALCLVDLDTVGPGSLAFELGDAWRSWCNRSGEDLPDARLDLSIFEASLDGYVEGLGRALDDGERRALLLGVEWVSLELAARFAADALFESYFGWDPARFSGRGEHNLVRARGQWSLHEALVASRASRAARLGSLP